MNSEAKSGILTFIIFLVINFAALGIGGIFTGKGVPSEWYQDLNKAPWTPPGWTFGAAWTMIMICFSFYMMYAWNLIRNKKLLLSLFVMQWILNVSWNPTFFHFHLVLAGLVVIAALTVLVAVFLFGFRSSLQSKSLWVLPYFLWLLVATSLNAFILFNN